MALSNRPALPSLAAGLLVAVLVPLAPSAAPPASPAAPAPGGGGFEPGDLYFFSYALTGLSTGNAGILRIDPVTGETTTLLGPVWGTAATAPDFAYDPFRDRLVVHLSLDGLSSDTYLVDSDGGTQSMGLTNKAVSNFAPTGDGRIYFEEKGGVNTDIQYFDAAGAIHQLMDATGTAPFQLDPSFATGLMGMIYDPGTNALFVATGSNAMVCPGGSVTLANLHKIPLSPDGSRTAGPVQCVQFDVDPTGWGEDPEGWSRGPRGELFLTVDTNLNGQQPRLVLVDPETLAVSTFAENGPYPGDAATNAGCYSHTRGLAFVVDTGSDRLRMFAEGSTGSGTELILSGGTSISPPGSSSEHCVLIEISTVGPQGGLTATPPELSIAAGGTQSWGLDVGPAWGGDLYLILGSLTGWTPPIVYGGVSIPLIPDFYTDFTAANANTALYPGSFGVLSGAGVGSPTGLVLPPGSFGPGAAGAVFYHAAVILDGGANALFATNAVTLELIP